MMLGSGLLADLRDANFHEEINRDEFRRICGLKPIAVTSKIVLVFSRDMRKEGWTLLEHVPLSITSISDLEMVPVLKKDEDRIGGEEMVRRARIELKANLGHEDAEWLEKHQNEIPKEWRNYYFTFPGTVWQGSDGFRCVPYLYWNGGRWSLRFYWLGLDWNSLGRILRLRKPACR